MKLLKYLLTVFLLPVTRISARGSKHTKRLDREWRDAAHHCEMFECAHIDQLENDNCVNQCTSELCFQEIYAENPVRSILRNQSDVPHFLHIPTITDFTCSLNQEKLMMQGIDNLSGAFVKRYVSCCFMCVCDLRSYLPYMCLHSPFYLFVCLFQISIIPTMSLQQIGTPA